MTKLEYHFAVVLLPIPPIPVSTKVLLDLSSLCKKSA